VIVVGVTHPMSWNNAACVLRAGELVAFVRARGIAVDRVAGGHGGVAAWADVERAAGP